MDENDCVALRFEPDEDGAGELSVKARASGYSGRSSAWFTADEVTSFAATLMSFGLHEPAPVHLRGGYWSPDGKLEQEHVGIVIESVGRLGQLAAAIHLAGPVDGNLDRGCEVRLVVFTTHERVRVLGKEIASMLRGEHREAVLGGELLG